MKFTFELDVGDFYEGEDGYGNSFKNVLIEEAARQVILRTYENEMDPEYYRSALKTGVDQILKDKQAEIIEAVIERVATKIEKKKRIVAETPSLSTLAAIDKVNEEYIATLIDKAIAKRFK